MFSDETLLFPGSQPVPPARLLRLAAAFGAVIVATLALTGPALANGNDRRAAHSTAVATVKGGNNGTIKLDGEPLSGGHANHPHLACNLNVEFFGFDKGTNTADVVIEAQSPSGSGTVPVANGAPLHFTFTGQGAGGAFDVAKLYTLDTSGLSMHPQQGFHIKWSVSVNGGNAKHKVIWVQPCAAPGKPDLALDKNGPSTGAAGGTGTYTIDVKNVGATIAAGPITVTDVLPAGETATSVTSGADLTCALTGSGSGVTCTRAASLAPAASTSQIVVHVAYGPNVAGNLVNTARVAGVQGETNLANNVDTVKTVLAKTPSGGPCTENIFHNTQTPVAGATVAAGQLLTVVYSDETVIGNGTNGGKAPVLTVDGVVRNGDLTVAPTAGPDRFNYLLSYRLATNLPDGTHTVTIQAFDSDQNKPGGDCDIASWALTVRTPPPPAPDVSIVKNGPQVSVRPGARLTYTLTAANTGTVAATGVRILDPLPSGLSLVSVAGPGWTCIANLVDCTLAASLPVGGSSAITVVADLASSYTAGSIVNVATVRPDDVTPGDNTSTLITPVQQGGLSQPDLSVVKSGPTHAVRPGGLVHYTLTVRNTGTVPATGFTVTDPLAGGLGFVSASGAGFACSGPGVSCRYVDTLAPGDSATISVVTRLSSRYSAVSVANTAVVSPTDATPGDNTSSFSVPVQLPIAGPGLPTPTPISGGPEQPSTAPPPVTAIPFTGAPVGQLLILAGLLLIAGSAAGLRGMPRPQV
jgi:uncharacterized repeat protein (TIGR01451 family)